MTDENENRPNRPPLTLKPRSGSISTGTVKQSFSHGRSKTVVVETKRPRLGAPPVNLAGPSAAEKRPAFDVRGPQPQRPAAPPTSDPHALSEDEQQRRKKVAAEFAARQQAERAAAEARAREAAAARAREAEAAKAAAPPPAAPAQPEALAEAPPTAPATAPVFAPTAKAPEPAPRSEAPPRPTPRAEAPRSAPGQTRTYDPATARRDDRERTTTYRPDRPPRGDGGGRSGR